MFAALTLERDPLTLAIVVAVVTFVGLAACAIRSHKGKRTAIPSSTGYAG